MAHYIIFVRTFASILGAIDPIVFFVPPWQDSCQEWRRYPAGTLASVRIGAGALDSCQDWCRCPGQCHEWCWNWPTESEAQRFPGCVIRRLSACIRVPHREGNSMGGLPLFNIGIPNRRGCCESFDTMNWFCLPNGVPSIIWFFLSLSFVLTWVSWLPGFLAGTRPSRKRIALYVDLECGDVVI